ncbi:PucR family transcriptional regulator ligand-binding domain-containing protein, partial [Paraburkholderia sp. SIMBA_030]
MSILLGQALNSETLKGTDPRIMSAADGALTRPVRWVHSSEVLDIAPLLRGGELLLSGGQALAGQTAERRVEY